MHKAFHEDHFDLRFIHTGPVPKNHRSEWFSVCLFPSPGKTHSVATAEPEQISICSDSEVRSRFFQGKMMEKTGVWTSLFLLCIPHFLTPLVVKIKVRIMYLLPWAPLRKDGDAGMSLEMLMLTARKKYIA